ncbi:MAG: CD1871A family CXXC motif-containing protein [Thermodesulfobacteriota bacterium]
MKKESTSPKRGIGRLTILSFILFLSLFLFGINVNEPQRVLEQAVNICLECIGIG